MFRKFPSVLVLAAALVLGACAGVDVERRAAPTEARGSAAVTDTGPTAAASPAASPASADRSPTPAPTEVTPPQEPTEAPADPTEAVEPTEAAEPTPEAEQTRAEEPPVDGAGGVYTVEAENDLGHVAQKDIKLRAHDGLRVQNVGYYTSGVGSLWFFGEVVNGGREDAAAIATVVDLYNERDERLARGASVRAASNVLEPGEKTVWFTPMSDVPARWMQTRIEVGQTISADILLERDYPDIEARDVELKVLEGYDDRVELRGTLVNTGKGPVDQVQVTAVLYEGGRIVDIASGRVEEYDDPIPAGKSSAFSATFPRERENPKDLKFEVYLAGREPLE